MSEEKEIININDYVPSILNPRAVRLQHNHSLTQASIVSRVSLSIKRPCGSTLQRTLMIESNKENCDIQDVTQETQDVPKDLVKQQDNVDNKSLEYSFQEELNSTQKSQESTIDLTESRSFQNLTQESQKTAEDLITTRSFQNFTEATKKIIKDLPEKQQAANDDVSRCDPDFKQEGSKKNKLEIDEVIECSDRNCDNESHISLSSVTELEISETSSVSTICYNTDDRPILKVSFGINDVKTVDVNAKNGAMKRFSVSHNDDTTEVDCELIESSQLSIESEYDFNMNETSDNLLKRSAAVVSLQIKKKKLTRDDSTENSKILILNTNVIEKISHVIVQPPNYKLVKRNISHKSKYKKGKSSRNGNASGAGVKQTSIESFFRKGVDATIDISEQLGTGGDDASKMIRNLGDIDAVKCDRMKGSKRREVEEPRSPKRRDFNESPQSARLPSKRDVKPANSVTPPPRSRNESISAHSPRKNVESLHFSLPVKSKSNKTSLSPRNIPHHKIVAGTHFAVDAFSYGEIPNVMHYFLTHFHSDHYSGLKKSFSKLLFCSKITADLCISRLGVNPKNIRVIDVDEVLRIEGVEVTAVDANHCPGALMLVFTLPGGKTLLHTGDFRACPQMESYPVFWNKDIHTVYLDTTYCNPRYDFPTQDQSLESALYILRQKKMALEKVGKKFSSVLIVCGSYTIGKEKFFLGMSRRVGCSVWACPEKERVLQAVEGRSPGLERPAACQLHVVPMRDLTHEKLRSYLGSLQGAFAEVVAFKPSGWENGKNASVEKDNVTIHGIPYSEHSSFSELIRFVKFLKPRQVVPTVDISGGVKAVQKYFPCPLVYKEEFHGQTKVTDYFSILNRQQVPAVT